MRLSRLAGISAVLVACTETADPIGAPDFSMAVMVDVTALELGSLNGYSSAVSINDVGQITGWSDVNYPDRRGFVYAEGLVSQITADGWSHVSPAEINATGQVVGNARGPNGSGPGFLWNGTLTDLGALVGTDVGTHVVARGVNDGPSPVVVGSMDVGGATHAFRWSRETGAQDLAGQIGGACSIAFAINDAGDIVGSRDASAFLLTASGALSILPNLPGGAYAVALEVNEAGVIVGAAATPTELHPVQWEDGVAIDLGTFGHPSNIAFAINDAGQIVGTANTSIPFQTCTIYEGEEEPEELNRVPFVWEDGNLTNLGVGLDAAAFGINNAQEVVGMMWNVPVRWTIAIEPTTPEEGTERIVDEVVALIDAEAVGSGTGNALLAKLDAVTRQLNEGNPRAAARLLESFIQQVEGWMVAGQIAPEEGEKLIQLAMDGLALIES